ncbi:MAG: YidC/Oxa1 family membrane protein insertase [Monoglobales bacterium]
MFEWLGIPLGWLLKIIYQFVENYGAAIIIFTIVTKFILFPLSLKQQKTMAQTQIIKPKLDALQKQYGDNKEKFSEESMKLYKKHGISPFSGCLPMLIQLPIILALYYVIKEPLHYIWGQTEAVIAQLCAENGIEVVKNGTHQIALTAKFAAEGKPFAINYNFLGLDLSRTPTLKQIDFIWIIPALAGLTTWLSSKLMSAGTQKKEEKANKRPPRPGEKDPTQTTNAMMNIMPFMTVWFAFMLPAGVGLYWIASNIFQLGQQYVLNRYYVPKIRERMAIENEELDSARKGRKNPGRGNKSRSK